MKKAKKLCLRIAAVITILGLAWLFRPYSQYDPNKIHSRLSALAKPIQYVQADGYLDGGSLSVLIIDASNTSVFIWIPVNDDGPRYSGMYFKEPNHSNGAPVELFYDRDSVAMLQQLIQEHERDHPYNDFAVAEWRGRGRDYLRLLWRHLTGYHDKLLSGQHEQPAGHGEPPSP